MRTGIFVGSFNPFTIGHADIVGRALTFVDRLVVGVGVNDAKRYARPAEERIAAMARKMGIKATVRITSRRTVDSLSFPYSKPKKP